MTRRIRVALLAVLPTLGLALSGCKPATAPAPAATPAPASRPAATAPTPAPATAVADAASATLETLVRPDDTLASLRARLGADNVVEDDLDSGEGDVVAGWRLYPKDPTRQLDIYLDGPDNHPAALVANSAATRWQSANGLRIGLDTVELQRMNGKPFTLLGFDWDYGGTITDWRGGKFDTGPGRHGTVVLCPPDDAPLDYPEGDGEFSSDDARLVKHPARVCEFHIPIGADDEHADAAGEDAGT